MTGADLTHAAETGADVRKRNRLDIARFCLVYLLPLIVIFIALIFAPLEAMRDLIPPATRLVSGPMYGGWLLGGPPVIVMFYFVIMFKMAVFEKRKSKKLIDDVFFDVLSRFKVMTCILLSISFVVYVYGLPAYWYATSEGVTVRQNWFQSPVSYNWNDVIERSISCASGRKGRFITSFIVKFRQGLEIDLASTQQQDAANHFAALASLTRNAQAFRRMRDLNACPAEVNYIIWANHY